MTQLDVGIGLVIYSESFAVSTFGFIVASGSFSA